MGREASPAFKRKNDLDKRTQELMHVHRAPGLKPILVTSLVLYRETARQLLSQILEEAQLTLPATPHSAF